MADNKQINAILEVEKAKSYITCADPESIDGQEALIIAFRALKAAQTAVKSMIAPLAPSPSRTP